MSLHERPVDWDRASMLFSEALELPEHARASWLEQQAGVNSETLAEVQSLLEAEERHRLLSAQDSGQDGAEVSDLPEEGTLRFGPYETVRVLGYGGMGTVYLARRADGEFDQTVALKLIAAPFIRQEFVRKFRTERQLLATLTHPNITRLLDGGVSTRGEPYLVMEYVDGEPLDRYCDANRLSIRSRLRLFLQLCDAVEFAHRNLVLHRDLKPANVLVTRDGTLKLLDFGTAALIVQGEVQAQLTRARMLTPRYSSPAQLRGDRSSVSDDVFSLGVIFYELLTGAWPFGEPNSMAAELKRATEDCSPAPPITAVTADAANCRGSSLSALARMLAGDLSAMALKALETDPNRRYATVAQLAADVSRYLEGRPVQARPQTSLYRGAKFVRRRWLPLAVAAIFVFGLSGAAIVAEHQMQVARAEALRAENVNRFLNDMLSSASTWRFDPKTYTVAQMLEGAESRLGANYPGDAWTEASLRLNLGASYVSMSRFDRARPQLDKALATFQALHDKKEIAWTLYIQANLAYSEGRAEEAMRKYDQTLEQVKQSGGAVPPELGFYAREQLAKTLSELNRRLPEAQILIDEAIALVRGHSSIPTVGLAAAMADRGAILRHQGKREEAEAAYRTALATARSIDPHRVWQHPILFGLADLIAPSEPAQAAELALQDYQLLAAAPMPHSQYIAVAKIHWLRLRADAGDLGDAVPEVLKSMEIVRRLWLPASLERWNALSSSAHVTNRAGRYAEAESLSREMFPILEANHLPENDERRAETLFELGTALHGEKKDREAAEALRQSAGVYDACGLPDMAGRARRILNEVQ